MKPHVGIIVAMSQDKVIGRDGAQLHGQSRATEANKFISMNFEPIS